MSKMKSCIETAAEVAGKWPHSAAVRYLMEQEGISQETAEFFIKSAEGAEIFHDFNVFVPMDDV